MDTIGVLERRWIRKGRGRTLKVTFSLGPVNSEKNRIKEERGVKRKGRGKTDYP